MSHPGIGLMRALARLPLPWLRALGGEPEVGPMAAGVPINDDQFYDEDD